MRRVQFADGECYHIYNRGVEKRNIFGARGDYERFLYVLFACNDHRPLVNTYRAFRGLVSIGTEGDERRDPYVDILCFGLMPNHFHLLLRQRCAGGVSAFLQKFGTAYTMYFNTKYERDGALFQGSYKAIHVPCDEYLLPLSRYIHLNPLDLVQPAWRERGIRDPKNIHLFLVEYPWSSYADYVGEVRYPFLVDTTLLRGIFPAPGEYAAYVEDWRGKEFRKVAGVVLEHV